MVSSPWSESHSVSRRGGVSVVDSASRAELLNQIVTLREELSQNEERLSRYRGFNESHTREIARLKEELEACKHNLQELNLLDGFLRSGAVRALNLENEPGLRELLSQFLGRALQTALDTGAIQFSKPTRPE